MNKVHLDFLKTVECKDQGAVGRNALQFGQKVQDIESLERGLDRRFNRNELFQFCNQKEKSNLTLAIAILSWGGMRFDHARTLFHKWSHLDPIIQDLRMHVVTSRQEAFQIFQVKRAQGHLPGLGIGYFTKLICFLNPRLNGYILDQWTAKSINLLWNESLVEVTRQGWVKDENTPIIYEEFCSRIEQIARVLEIKPLQAEELIFSVGGRNEGRWRKYLIDNYLP